MKFIYLLKIYLFIYYKYKPIYVLVKLFIETIYLLKKKIIYF